MATIDLDALSLEELKKLQKDVGKAIDSFQARQRQDALAAVQNTAKEFGFDLGELTGAGPKRKKQTAAPKYRHPDDPSQTWSGRGRQPDWMKEALAAGRSKDEFLIQQ